MSTKRGDKQRGFAVVEIVLLLIIAGLVVGVGYWVFSQRKNNAPSTSTVSQAAQSQSAQPGTTAAVDAASSAEGTNEEKAADKAVTGVNSSVQQTQNTTAN